jgi:hypothetical protein
MTYNLMEGVELSTIWEKPLSGEWLGFVLSLTVERINWNYVSLSQ